MIKTFSSRAGRLSETNKFYLHKKSKCIFSEKKLIIHEQKVLDVGFGDSDSFCKDIIENNDFLFFGAEPYKKGFSRAVEFFEKNNVKNMILFNGDVRDLLEKVKFCFDFIRIHFPDPWPKKKHKKRRLIQQKFLDDLNQILKYEGKLIISTDHDVMKSWVLEHLHIRNDFLWIKNGYYYRNIKPKWIVNTKYSNKALENNKVVDWFFFKKK